jgi:site-specific recombinase XerD
MNQFDQSVERVVSFLREQKYTASTVCAHKKCYSELRTHLTEAGIGYSFETALDWIKQENERWSRRKSANYRHFIVHLDDMDRLGGIPAYHLSYHFPPFTMLSGTLAKELGMFLDSIETENMRENMRMRCSNFLLFLQERGVSSVAETTYSHIRQFLDEDTHKTRKSKDVFECAARRLLAFHHRELGISIGLSYACNKQMSPHIQPPAKMPENAIEEVTRLRSKSLGFPLAKYHDAIDGYVDCLKKHLYSKNIRKHAKRTCRLLYLFFDMHGTGYSLELGLLWLSELKPALGSSWKQTRRALMQLNQYATLGDIAPEKVYRYKGTSLSRLPRWCVDKVTEYLDLRRKEGLARSSIDMCRSSCVRLCAFLVAQGVSSFHDIEASHLVLFNRLDPHETAEGKNAYNVRIRMFLEYLEEGILSDKPMLHKALQCQCADKERVTVVFNGDEMSRIAAFCRGSATPYELRQSAMVLLGLRMGLRASDIVNLKFADIDWAKQTVSIVQKKTLKFLSLPLPVEVANSLYRYVRDGRPRSESPFLFIHHRVPFGKLGKEACRQAIHAILGENARGGFHTTRRTFATNLLRAGVGVNTIIDSLGHSTDDTVNEYLSLDEGRMRLCAMSLAEAGIPLEGGLSL